MNVKNNIHIEGLIIDCDIERTSTNKPFANVVVCTIKKANNKEKSFYRARFPITETLYDRISKISEDCKNNKKEIPQTASELVAHAISINGELCNDLNDQQYIFAATEDVCFPDKIKKNDAIKAEGRILKIVDSTPVASTALVELENSSNKKCTIPIVIDTKLGLPKVKSGDNVLLSGKLEGKLFGHGNDIIMRISAIADKIKVNKRNITKTRLIMDERYIDMFRSAWRVSVDAREKVRGQAAEVFGKDAEWTRSFDFQRPVEGYGSIKGFRFMNDGDKTRMFVIRHDGNFELLPDKPDEKFVNKMMSELEQAKLNPTRICGWYDSETAAQEEKRLNHHNTYPANRSTVTEACPGFFFVHYDDLSACLKNSSNQRIDCPISHNEFIKDFRYAGSLDGREHFAYEAVPDYGGQTIYGLFDINGRESFFPHINEYDNRDKRVPALCKAFQEMVKKSEMAEGKNLGMSNERNTGKEMGIAKDQTKTTSKKKRHGRTSGKIVDIPKSR